MVPASVNEKYVIRFCAVAQNAAEEDIGDLFDALRYLVNFQIHIYFFHQS